MDATLLLLSADCTAAASGRLRPRLPAGPHVASPGPSARPRTSIRASAASAALAVRGLPHHASVAGQSTGSYTVGDVMTKREDLHVVKPTTSVDEALEMLVKHRITGFPVIDDDWNLVGVVSDYDLLALDSISGNSEPTQGFPGRKRENGEMIGRHRGEHRGDEGTKYAAEAQGKDMGRICRHQGMVGGHSQGQYCRT